MADETRSLTYITLSPTTKRVAKMGAARSGLSLSGYIERLIERDAQRTGLADILAADKEEPDVR